MEGLRKRKVRFSSNTSSFSPPPSSSSSSTINKIAKNSICFGVFCSLIICVIGNASAISKLDQQQQPKLDSYPTSSFSSSIEPSDNDGSHPHNKNHRHHHHLHHRQESATKQDSVMNPDSITKQDSVFNLDPITSATLGGTPEAKTIADGQFENDADDETSARTPRDAEDETQMTETTTMKTTTIPPVDGLGQGQDGSAHHHHHHHHRQNHDKGIVEMEAESKASSTAEATATTATAMTASTTGDFVVSSTTEAGSTSSLSTAFTTTTAPTTSSAPDMRCSFGGQSYNIGDSFNPDLGEPFGVMFCIRCTCIEVGKRGKTVARVKCKNYKNSCPTPTCSRPVLGPRSCCKICPGQEDPATWTTTSSSSPPSSGVLSEEPQRSEGGVTKRDAQRIEQRFMALLTGNMARPRQESSGVARGYFHLDETNLHYSIHFRGLARNRGVEAIIFLDTHGTTMHFHQVKPQPGSEYFGYKVCGIWKNLKPHQIEKLLDDRVRVALTTGAHPSGEIGGLLRTHRILNDESFSGILAPPSNAHHQHRHNGKHPPFIGGAAVTFAVDRNLLNFVIFPDEDFIDVKAAASADSPDAGKVLVRLESQSKDAASVEIGAAVTSDWKWVEIADVFKLTDAQLRDLAAGALRMVVVDVSTGKELSGRIFPKQECGVIHALLGENVGVKEVESGAGSAIFKLYPDGNLAYKIRIAGVEKPVESISLYAGEEEDMQHPSLSRGLPLTSSSSSSSSVHKKNRHNYHQRKRQPLAEFAHNYNRATNMAVGKYEKVSASVIQSLMTGNLHLHVFVSSEKTSILKGTLTQIDIGGALKDQLEEPGSVLFEEDFESTGGSAAVEAAGKIYAGAAGVVWFEMDKDCHLHYKILTSGLPLAGVSLALRPRQEVRGGEGGRVTAAQRSTVLKTFSGSESEGVFRESLPDATYHSLQRGEATVELTSDLNTHISGTVLPVQNKCFARPPSPPMIIEDNKKLIDNSLKEHCIDEGVDQQPGSRWTPKRDRCATCTCSTYGRVDCQRAVCPALSGCRKQTTSPGDCCPICVDGAEERGEAAKKGSGGEAGSECGFGSRCGKGGELEERKSCFFDGDKKYHPVGSTWHPYVPPFGYVKCAVCRCTANGEGVNCTRNPCPPLPCPSQYASRRHPTDCCKTCDPHYTPKPKPTRPPQDDLPEGSCYFNKEYHLDGSRWHPRVIPIGVMRCITCQCAAGKSSCKRAQCPKLKCRRRVKRPNACCPVCAPSRGGGGRGEGEDGGEKYRYRQSLRMRAIQRRQRKN